LLIDKLRFDPFFIFDGAGALAGLLTRETLAEMMMIKSAQPDWTFKRRW
jgi:hypothetical protein